MGKNNPKTFSVLSSWQEYLATEYPEGSKMKPMEYRRTKLAFYAAYGAALIVMRDEVAFLPQRTVWEVLRNLVEEITNFHATRSPEDFLSKEQLEREVDDERAV